MALGEYGFSVDPAELRRFVNHLSAISGFMDSARLSANEQNADAFGFPRLTQATRDFVNHWEWHGRQIGERISGLAETLKGVSRNYESVEETQAAAQSGSGHE